MCDLMNCKDCSNLCKENITDRDAEKLWELLEDVPVCEDEDGCMCLDVDWQGWNKGTDRETIWHWFDDHHSKGVGWLMNEYEPGNNHIVHKSIEEQKQAARNTNELLDHLVRIIEQNDERFSFELATGGEYVVMEIFDKEKKIGYAVKIEPIEYDENGEAVNL